MLEFLTTVYTLCISVLLCFILDKLTEIIRLLEKRK